MLIRKLRLNYFGRFNNKEIELEPGINLIYGENEAGKSTIHTFIKGMFFGIQRGRGRAAATKEDLYTRYLPWEYPGAFAGSMDIEIEGRKLRLGRNFHASEKDFSILDLSTGRERKAERIDELVPSLSETTFRNTVSIEQLKAQTDSELATQVRNYIANLSVAKSNEVNVAKAISFLTEQRKQLEPTQNPAMLKALQGEIQEGIAREERLERLYLKLNELLGQEKQLRKQQEELTVAPDSEAAQRMEHFPAVLEKYHSYQELHNEVEQLEKQVALLRNRSTENEKHRQNLEQLKNDKKAAEVFLSDLYDLDKQEQVLKQEENIIGKRGKKAFYYRMLPAALSAILIFVLYGVQPIGLLLTAVVLVVGVVCLILLTQKNKQGSREMNCKKDTLAKKRTDARNAIMDILTRYQVNTIEALADRQEELLRSLLALEHTEEQIKELELRKGSAQDSLDSMYDTIMSYLQYFIETDELSPEAMQRITEELHCRKQESLSRHNRINESLEACRLEAEKLRWEISALEGKEEELLANQLRYEKLKQQQAESATCLEAIKLALTSIGELSAQIHDSFGHQLNNAVSGIIGQVTGQKYNELKIDEKLDIKVGRNGDYVPLEGLSAGTIDQVYFALRLAVADLLLGEDEIPLIFDDSFALYDDTRVKAALNEITKRRQVILFTCHKREQRLLEELKLPYHLIKLA